MPHQAYSTMQLARYVNHACMYITTIRQPGDPCYMSAKISLQSATWLDPLDVLGWWCYICLVPPSEAFRTSWWQAAHQLHRGRERGWQVSYPHSAIRLLRHQRAKDKPRELPEAVHKAWSQPRGALNGGGSACHQVLEHRFVGWQIDGVAPAYRCFASSG